MIHAIHSKSSNKKIWKLGEAAGMEEIQQIHDRKMFTPVDWRTLTREQKKMALESLIFIKEKRCGRLKRQSCADGIKQRYLYTKEETASQTVAIESVFITSVINATKNET